MVCITAHYVEDRLHWLKLVLETFANYNCPVLVLLYTNDINLSERAKMEAIVPKGLEVELRICDHLEHRFDLAWSHKSAVAQDFLGKDFTHFIYLEDDIVIDIDCFTYWRTHRQFLRSRGLVPGFVRVERVSQTKPWYATDQFSHTIIDWLRTVKFGPWSFTNLDSPYVASFILDQSLAYEHVASPSFKEVTSRTVKPSWGSRERAALGITFDNVPMFFQSRLVVPFDRQTLQVPHCARVVHAPGNYVQDLTSDLAKLPLMNLLRRQSLVGQIKNILNRAKGKLLKP